MRIFGKVCCWAAAVMLILQGITVICGYPLSGIAVGIELIVMAVWCITDVLIYFKNPTHHIEVDMYVSFESGEVERFHSDKVGSMSEQLPQHDGKIDGIGVFVKEVTGDE